MTAKLVVLPYAGHLPGCTRSLAGLAPAGWDIAELVFPGHGDNQTPISDVGLLSAKLAQDVTAMVDGVPYALFGHSFGALMAAEVLNHLVAKGFPPPVHVFLSGLACPEKLAQQDYADLTNLTDAEMLKSLAKEGFVDELLPQDFATFVAPALRADYTALAQYASEVRQGIRPTYVPPNSIPTSTWAGDADPWASEASMCGWGASVHEVVPGGHQYLKSTEGAQILMCKVGKILAPSQLVGSALRHQSFPEPIQDLPNGQQAQESQEAWRFAKIIGVPY